MNLILNGIIGLIGSIISSLILIFVSQIYSWRKNRKAIITAIFYKVKMNFDKDEAKSLWEIKNQIEDYKSGLRILVISFAYLITIVASSFRVFNSISTLIEIFSIVYPISYNIVIYVFRYRIYKIFSTLSQKIRNKKQMSQNVTNTSNKKQSYEQYILTRSSSWTISDLRYDIIFNLPFYFIVYVIISSQTTNSSLILSNLVYYFISFLLILLLFPWISYFILMILFGKRWTEYLSSVDSIIFNDAINDIKKNVRIKVWTGSGIYEGEVKNIEDELVISPLSDLPTNNEIHIRWELIQVFEIIEQKCEQNKGIFHFM